MLRFIDLRGQIDIYDDDKPLEEQHPQFAFFDTVMNRFFKSALDTEVWTNRADFIADADYSESDVERYLRLMPEWVP